MAIDEKDIWMVYYCYCYGNITVVEKKVGQKNPLPQRWFKPNRSSTIVYSYDLAIININSGYLFSMYLSAFHQTTWPINTE